MTDLPALLLDTGLLQFGRFESGKPYRLLLDLLPSYPDVLQALIHAAAPSVGEVDHLLCTIETLPFGTGLSLQKQIPLVYSRGTDLAPVYDLAGAYDIGHPALLLANQSEARLSRLITGAQSVGLEIRAVLVIVDDGVWNPNNLPLQSLIQMPALIDTLMERNMLPVGQAQLIKAWINHHPG
jgi:hypothetical protein